MPKRTAQDKARRKLKRQKALKKIGKKLVKVGKEVKRRKIISKALKIGAVPAGLLSENPQVTARLLAASQAVDQLGFGAKKPCKKKRSDAGKKRPPSAWIKHVKATRAKNPSMSYSDAMKAASKTYKKKGQGGSGIRLAGLPAPPRQNRSRSRSKPCRCDQTGRGLALPGGQGGGSLNGIDGQVFDMFKRA